MTSFLPRLQAKKIIYVSCNPTTQARDAQILLDKGYDLEKLTIVDMFPHTPHIESVGIFTKNKSLFMVILKLRYSLSQSLKE